MTLKVTDKQYSRLP